MDDPATITDHFAAGWCETFLHAVNSRNIDHVLALGTDDVVVEDPLIHPSGRLHGAAELAAWLRSIWTAIPDLTFTGDGPPFVSLDRLTVCHAWTVHGRMTGPLDPPGFAPTHRPIEVSGVHVFSYRDQRLTRVRALFDAANLSRQIGAAPPANSTRERLVVRLQHLTARLSSRTSDTRQRLHRP